ncbi:MAG TPA: hypothetical protein VK395_19275, partial [Gemmataceae bacterium]|nr:hypothetical protein [Gemmataceae bacterium]
MHDRGIVAGIDHGNGLPGSIGDSATKGKTADAVSGSKLGRRISLRRARCRWTNGPWRKNFENGPDAGPARILGNLGRLAPGLIDSYTVLRVASCGDSWRANNGENSPRVLGR